MPKSIELAIPGLSIAGTAWGDPKNPPILALHGWLDNANSFEQIAGYLESNYYFIAIDLPGHGLSSHIPSGSHYYFTDGLFCVLEIIKALKLNKVHLLGHSLGACLASMVAGIAPNKIHSLSLIEGLGPLVSPEETACDQLFTYSHQLLEKPHKTPKGYQSFEAAAEARARQGYISLDLAKTLCARGVVEKEGLFYWRHDRRLVHSSPLKMTEGQVLSCLERIQAKTYLILATQGFSFSKLIECRIKTVPNIAVDYLEGGHHLHMEHPELIAKHLTAFYNSVEL